MELIVQESGELEGTGEVIIQIDSSNKFNTGDKVKLNLGERICGGIVKRIENGENQIVLDKYLRLHLIARVGEMISVECSEFEAASLVQLHVPPNWNSLEGNKLLKTLLLGRPLITEQKFPLFTFSGSMVTIDVGKTEPSGIVLFDPETHLELVGLTQKEQTSGITYKDIGGLDRELKRIRELVEFPLRSSEVFTKLGIEAPKGLILYGPPGTGKTLIAKALSNEVGAKFYQIQGPEMISEFYGQSERALREIFEKARKNSPAIILIDELDALAPKRDQVRGELEQRMVATMLSVMDGLTEMKNVVVIGTTNRINSIDPALRRPGRFEHEIHIGASDVSGRSQIFSIHTRRMPLGKDVNLQLLAEKTPGFVGADIASLCREAGYTALRRSFTQAEIESGEINHGEGIKITVDDFMQALVAIKPSAMREVMVMTPQGVHWDQIGGLEEVKRHIKESVVFGMQKGEAYRKAGTKPAKGLLLYGPPGTGKSLLAKAVVNECGANLILVRGPEIYSKWFGESEEKIRFIFSRAREVAPSIIFFDEIDAIAPARGRSISSNRTEESVVNQLLTELDSIDTVDHIFVIAATNMADQLDPALLRPGRFDLQILVPLPDIEERKQIFYVHTKSMPLSKDINFEYLAKTTEKRSGADIAEICRMAAVIALRLVNFSPTDEFNVSFADFKLAIEEVNKTIRTLKPKRIGFNLEDEDDEENK